MKQSGLLPPSRTHSAPGAASDSEAIGLFGSPTPSGHFLSTVGDLMLPHPVSCQRGLPISTAYADMRERHLQVMPVLVGNKAMGVLVFDDVMRLCEGAEGQKAWWLEHFAAEDVMRPAVHLPDSAPVVTAAAELRAPGVACLMIERAGDLVGIVTAQELAQAKRDGRA